MSPTEATLGKKGKKQECVIWMCRNGPSAEQQQHLLGGCTSTLAAGAGRAQPTPSSIVVTDGFGCGAFGCLCVCLVQTVGFALH